MAPGPHLDLLLEAIAVEGEGQRALLAGEEESGRAQMRAASRLYRESWELAPPGSYGRLIGMLKAAVIAAGPEAIAEAGQAGAAGGPVPAGDAPGRDLREQATYAREQVGDPGESAPAHYALAIAALLLGEDEEAVAAAQGMHSGSAAFIGAAVAIEALGGRQRDAYAKAIAAIVADFESRETHLTGVPIADTALMLQRLAAPRGLHCAPVSPLLPAVR